MIKKRAVSIFFVATIFSQNMCAEVPATIALNNWKSELLGASTTAMLGLAADVTPNFLKSCAESISSENIFARCSRSVLNTVGETNRNTWLITGLTAGFLTWYFFWHQITVDQQFDRAKNLLKPYITADITNHCFTDLQEIAAAVATEPILRGKVVDHTMIVACIVDIGMRLSTAIDLFDAVLRVDPAHKSAQQLKKEAESKLKTLVYNQTQITLKRGVDFRAERSLLNNEKLTDAQLEMAKAHVGMTRAAQGSVFLSYIRFVYDAIMAPVSFTSKLAQFLT